MDKAVIVGIYEFIGYQLCEALLQEGIQVYGVHIPSNTPAQIVDEKRLLIGRNSNFIEKDDTFLSTLGYLANDAFIFFDYYSFYMNRKEDIFMRKIQTCLEYDLEAAVMLPVQKLETEIDHNTSSVLSQCKFHFYLPCIYGPWQPSNYFFHKALLEPNQTHPLEEREWTKDTIFVEDVVEIMIKTIEEKNTKSALLKSSIEDHWQKVATELSQHIPRFNPQRHIEIGKNLAVINVKGVPYKEGIQRQKKYITQIENSN
ncbi:hypothetical protein R4Z10_05245 [Niallia sp. XMNu-256]|uniref:hypothetical protein n=1 Tax=Niallia sp. XMNu-256 TaxID=3082444 RepID=UPI0030D5D596